MADATWRIYGWCSDTPPPCDQEVGNTIVSGGAGQLLFYKVDGLTAWANVTASTDGTTLSPGSIVALTLQPYGLAQLTRSTADPNPLILCGSTTVLPPDVQATNPCGS